MTKEVNQSKILHYFQLTLKYLNDFIIYCIFSTYIIFVYYKVGVVFFFFFFFFN